MSLDGSEFGARAVARGESPRANGLSVVFKSGLIVATLLMVACSGASSDEFDVQDPGNGDTDSGFVQESAPIEASVSGPDASTLDASTFDAGPSGQDSGSDSGPNDLADGGDAGARDAGQASILGAWRDTSQVFAFCSDGTMLVLNSSLEEVWCRGKHIEERTFSVDCTAASPGGVHTSTGQCAVSDGLLSCVYSTSGLGAAYTFSGSRQAADACSQ